MFSVKSRSRNTTGSAGFDFYQPTWTTESYVATGREGGYSDDRSGQQITPVLVDSVSSSGSQWQPGIRLHHLFEQRCRDFGLLECRRHVAVEYEDQSYSYTSLLKLSRKMARFLAAQGLKPGGCVGLLVDRSIFSHAAVLALSMLDVRYVPLDSTSPATRMMYILKDCGAQAILTLSDFAEQVEESIVKVVVLDQQKDDIDGCSSMPLPKRLVSSKNSDSVAYVIYTSGTTGQPKGVSINQSSICNFLYVASQHYGYTDADRVYQGMSIAFDFSFEECWVPLVAGATLVPAPSGVNLLGEDLSEFLKSRRISAFCCVPTLLATLNDDLPDLRLLLVSGENCPADLIRPWIRSGRRVINAYGPTEATVTATWNVLDCKRNLSIGGPLPTYSVVILAPGSTEPIPIGEPGEICIAGIGLSTGYLNNEEKTKTSFIDDFIGIRNNPGRKIYRTGDLGRINADCEIEYLGRIDSQVKIRGYRIELDEIECVIRNEKCVEQVVVNPCTVDSEADTVELVAYLKWVPGVSPQQASELQVALHRSLASRLPSYMLPSYYQSVDEIPRLTSSKVDRRSLPAPTVPRISVVENVIVNPANEQEKKLTQMLCRLMKVDEISTDADFFTELGANSLLMAQFATALRKENPANRISMKMLYQNSTIVELAKVLEQVPTGRLVTEIKSDTTSEPIVPVVDSGTVDSNRSQASSIRGSNGCRSSRRECETKIPSTAVYVRCALLQSASFVLMTFLLALCLLISVRWIGSSQTFVSAYLRAIVCGTVIFSGAAAGLIVIKWLAIGRFDRRPIEIWSFKYFRFWLAKSAIRINPLNVFTGTPLYNLYLRLLGAKVGDGSVILSRTPVCTDLLSVGKHAVVRQDTYLQGYRAESGYIYPGSVHIGSYAFVGEASVLGTDTRIGDAAQLGMSSALLRDREVPDGASYHGSPAQACNIQFKQLRSDEENSGRRIVFTIVQLVAMALVVLPIPYLFVYLLENALDVSTIKNGFSSPVELSTLAIITNLFSSAALVYVSAVLIGLFAVLSIPRVLTTFFVSETVHPLYGLQYVLARAITRFSNSRMLNTIFGDSSLVLHYLSALGYDLSESTQTGSNFGVDQRHHSPFLCKFNRNTLVSDGLMMVNVETSSDSFRASHIEVPADSYLGNLIHYPPRAKVGKNCLIATKAMVPIDGPLREGVGILGSPSFEIPRSVMRDRKFDHYKKPEVLKERLRMKLNSNLVTLAIYIFRNISSIFLSMLIFWQLNQKIGLHVQGSLPKYAAFLTLFSLIALSVTVLYSIAFERLVLFFSPLKPLYCSLYEREFWRHERFWKLNYNAFIVLFNGTPFKGLLLRLQGVRIGKKVFDDGMAITEPAMVKIGDYCNLNYSSSAQCHSLEDGTFKSERIAIGSYCTVGVRGFVHYGTTTGDDVVIEDDAFVMKGSEIDAHRTWVGNPARDAETDDVEFNTDSIEVISLESQADAIDRRKVMAG